AGRLAKRKGQVEGGGGDRRQFVKIGGACGERAQTLLGRAGLTGQVFTFRPSQLQRKREVVPTLPAIGRQQPGARRQIRKCRRVGRARPGTFACSKVELGQLFALVLFGDERNAAVELIGDLEDGLPPPLWRAARRQQSSNLQMRRRPAIVADQ